MTLDAVIMLIGAITAVLPFLGFPSSWDHVFFFILGVIIIALGIVVRRRRSHHIAFMNRAPSVPSKQSFVEATPVSEVSPSPQEFDSGQTQ